MKRIFLFSVCALFLFSFSVLAEPQEISYGIDYDLVTPSSLAYPDDGIKLTDGIYGTHPQGAEGYYADNAYVGFNKNDVNANGKFAIILDLGEIKDNISMVTIGYLNEPQVGIHAPKTVEFSISDQRNGNYTLLGSVDTRPMDANVASGFAKSLENINGSGRYILVAITPGDYTGKVDTASISPWTFIDEISVHASETAAESTKDESDKDNNNGNNDVNAPGESVIPTDDEELPPEKFPQTGDESSVLGFVLLALAAVTMAVALFIKSPKRRF